MSECLITECEMYAALAGLVMGSLLGLVLGLLATGILKVHYMGRVDRHRDPVEESLEAGSDE